MLIYYNIDKCYGEWCGRYQKCMKIKEKYDVSVHVLPTTSNDIDGFINKYNYQWGFNKKSL